MTIIHYLNEHKGSDIQHWDMLEQALHRPTQAVNVFQLSIPPIASKYLMKPVWCIQVSEHAHEY